MERAQGRRLHTIAGAIVLGGFLVEHLATNASVLSGAASYDRVVGALQRWRLGAIFEILFVLVPLAYHAGYGVQLLRRSAPDAEIERYGDRRMWMLQRGSATVVFLFVVIHFLEVRAQRLFFGAGPEATYTILSAHLSWTWAGVPWVALGYILGIGATCFHLANGLYAATALRGWATSRMRVLTSLVGAALFTLGFLTVLAFATGTRLSDPAESEVPCGSAVPISSSRP